MLPVQCGEAILTVPGYGYGHIRLDKDVVAYFEAMSAKTGIPYQNQINLYLRDCAERGRELKMRWAS